jgi:hypothetical protein
VVDPIADIGVIAQKHNVPLHVDACVGGFMLPWVKKLGYPVLIILRPLRFLNLNIHELSGSGLRFCGTRRDVHQCGCSQVWVQCKRCFCTFVSITLKQQRKQTKKKKGVTKPIDTTKIQKRELPTVPIFCICRMERRIVHLRHHARYSRWWCYGCCVDLYA